MAIDYKQLRSGNLLLNHKGEVHKVTPWDIWNFECMVTPGAHFDKRLDLWRYIPLDEEWFLKANFQKVDNRFVLGFLSISFVMIGRSGLDFGYFITGMFESMQLKYVHQFQNLYHSLTGTELEIKE